MIFKEEAAANLPSMSNDLYTRLALLSASLTSKALTTLHFCMPHT